MQDRPPKSEQSAFERRFELCAIVDRKSHRSKARHMEFSMAMMPEDPDREQRARKDCVHPRPQVVNVAFELRFNLGHIGALMVRRDH